MTISIKFVFIAATVITIFASGAILMSLISTGASAVSPEISDEADRYSGIFLMTTVFLVLLSAVVLVLIGGKRTPFF